MDNFDTDGADPIDVHSGRPALSVECDTCVATGTTACADCIVTHLLANDDGPIDLVTVPVDGPTGVSISASDRAVALFQQAGLLDDPIEYVDLADFDDGVVVRVGR